MITRALSTVLRAVIGVVMRTSQEAPGLGHFITISVPTSPVSTLVPRNPGTAPVSLA